jgi:eukaryotic-like serine/threonine-protein kinase
MQSDDHEDLQGRVLGGVYRLEALLGEGGMGAVYGARHQRTGRPYAVKVLKLEVAARRDAMRRFAREAEAVGALHHANVVAIHDFHEIGRAHV